MLTQTIPALVNALSGTLPEAALRSLTQALGNCNQPLTHRSNVSFLPRTLPEDGPGWTRSGAWSPADYADLLPALGDAGRGMVDMPGWGDGSQWATNNYFGDTFNFPTNQQFSLNNYYGGPNIYNAGNQYTENLFSENHTTQNITANNITVQNINGQPIAGPAGAPGAPGPAGIPGLDGADGVNGVGNLRVERGLVGPYYRAQVANQNAGIFVDVQQGLVLETDTVSIPTTVTFDPETCDVALGGLVDVTFVKKIQGKRASVQGLKAGGPDRVVTNVQ